VADDKKTNWRREEWRLRALKSGGANPLKQLPFLKSNNDPWTVEHQKRQQEVKDQYWRDKKSMTRQRQLDDRHLREQLRWEKDEIDTYYRLHELDDKDPRLKKAKRMARRKFELAERKMRRKQREGWQKQKRKLQIDRDRQLRKVTQAMKKESRAARDLPTGPGDYL